ncbi:hypothetical protein Hypma_002701 [Hypsizygus marmoreus]|uniref:Uncharacterized protein n=1 Tax=Hypsizygus marmoreus TaxID=39966 RepID=A0A369J3B6_HYPMA|nr:hypothetical protein Hypma_002701 [Hypsizygus marmoreus]
MSYKGIPSFELKYTLNGHTKPINSLAVSADGSLLLSAVGAFAFGCAAGSYTYIFKVTPIVPHSTLPRLHPLYGGAVEGLAFDPYHRRLASVGAGCLNVYDMDINGQLTLLQSTPKRPFIPRNVAFFDRGKNVVVCFLESHETGNASLSIDERTLIVSNLKDGIDTYSLSSSPALEVLPPPDLMQCSALLMTVHPVSSIWTWNAHTNPSPQSRGGLVQAVTAYSHNGYYLLVTGASDIRSTADIKVWAESKANQLVQVQPKRAFLSFSAWQVIAVLLASIVMQMLVSQILHCQFSPHQSPSLTSRWLSRRW